MNLIAGNLFCGVAFLFMTVLVIADQQLNRVKRSDPMIVATVLNEPFCKKDDNKLVGYIPDLMEKISEKTNLSFKLQLVSDGTFGRKDASGNWDGMIGQLINGQVALAAAPLTITDARKGAVDFSEPFMSVNLSLLMMKPKDEEKLRINNAKELAEQTDIKCGLLANGTTYNFFSSSNDPIYKKIFELIQSDSKNMLKDFNEGMQRMKETDGRFAIIMESAMADYYVGRKPCDKTSINLINHTYHYALAMPLNAGFKTKLNEALHLLGAGNDSEMERLKRKWWKSECSSAAMWTRTSSGYGSLTMLVAVLLLSLVVSI